MDNAFEIKGFYLKCTKCESLNTWMILADSEGKVKEFECTCGNTYSVQHITEKEKQDGKDKLN